jgi:ABC-type branched-subunit amino acid transport system substrate-binding protein
MKTVVWLRYLAVLLVLGVVAAACADDEPAPEPEDADEAEVEETEEPEEEPVEVDEAARGDGTLRIGYLLPETGTLAFYGPPTITAVELAVEDINGAGGVLGNDVELVGADEAGDTAVASTSVDRLLAEGVDAIIGAVASGMSLAVIDKVIGAGVVQCSPANTSPTFTEYDDDGFYHRTAPTDALQGPVLAETMVGDGHATVAIMARADDYGQGLADETEAALEEAGAEVVAKVIYDPEAASYTAEVEQVAGAGPDAVVLISFDEAAQILQELIEAGMGPADFPVYGAESLRSTELPTDVDPADETVLDGLKGTAPISRADETFIDRLQEFNPDLTDFLFAGEAYDCATVIALAATAAGSDDPAAFVGEMIGVTRDGTECTSFAECAELLEAGEDIDYNGASGPIEFTDAGEPARGTYEVWEFEEGEIVTIDEVESTF